jgi:glycerophosphoryl diester phosphodiesterase
VDGIRRIAHRGGSREAPENTLAAFRRAADLGCDAVELDLRVTADRSVVVLHDPDLDRVTDGAGPVAARTLAEVRRLDAAHWFVPSLGAMVGAADYPLRGSGADDLRVPTLEEVLRALPDVPLVMDLKVGPPEMPWLPGAVAELLAAAGRRDDVVVGSFDQGRLDAFRSAAPAVPTSATQAEVAAFWAGGPPPPVPGFAAFQVPRTFGDIEVVTPDFVERAHEADAEVHVWTVDDPAEMRELAAIGVDGLITDVPSVLTSLR